MTNDLLARIHQIQAEFTRDDSPALDALSRTTVHDALYNLGYRFPEKKSYSGAHLIKRDHEDGKTDIFAFHPLFSEAYSPACSGGCSYLRFSEREAYLTFEAEYLKMRDLQKERDGLLAENNRFNNSNILSLLGALAGTCAGALSYFIEPDSATIIAPLGTGIGFWGVEQLIGRSMKKCTDRWYDCSVRSTDLCLNLETKYGPSVVRGKPAILKALTPK